MDIKNSITELWQTFSNRAKRIDIIQDLKPFCLKLGDTPDVANNTGIQKITLIPKNITADYVVNSLDSAFVLSDDLNSGNWYSMLKLNADITRDVYIKTIKSNVLGNYNADIAIFSSELEERRLSLEGHTGDGTSANPYPVACPAQLDDVRNGLDKYYKQYCNIALDPNTHFPSIGNYDNKFVGSYDGNNYKITGFFENTYNTYTDGTGLFGCVASTGILKNIWLYGKIDIPSSISINRIGLLCGYNWNTTINCHAFGSIKCRGYRIGGLSGELLSASGCSAEVDIEGLSGSSYIGGLAGNIGTANTFTNNYSKCNIRGYGTYIGGLTGQKGNSNFKIENCYCNAYINMTTATNIGGFIGKDEFIKTDKTSEYTNCYCNTIIEGAGTKKGFIGAIVDGCTSTQTGCVWNKELSDIADDALLPAECGLEDKYMRLRQTFIDLGWSESIWLLEDGNYPKLRCEIL